MISKFSKMHNSLFTKIVLSVTALSFMSLFGVSGYINTANSNKTVIKVDDIEIPQSTFSYMLQREMSKLKGVLGNQTDENEELKNELISNLAKVLLDKALLDNTMRKYNIDFTNNLISQIIQFSPQFQNNGQFDRETYNWYLRRNGLDEKELIADIKRSVARKILLDSQVAQANVPEVLQKQMEKVLGQRRNFRYIKVVNNNAAVSREPSAEELEQYYTDLSEEFIVPEKRDVSLMYLSMNTLENNMEVSDEEIDEYYKNHREEFEHDEQRDVMQIVFDSKENAEKALKQLKNGADFMSVATENGQTPEDTEFGLVSKNDLADELADVVFDLREGQFSNPVEVNGSWQIVKVKKINAASRVSRADANAQISSLLKQEKAYDNSYEVISAIEDKLGAGTPLAEVAQNYHASVIDVKGLGEDGTSSSRNQNVEKLLENREVVDAAFSYNEGEASQTIESNDGFVVVQVNKIHEPHLLPQNEVAGEIKKIWTENEKASITQETIDNIEHDLEAGDSLKDVANRYGLALRKTMPITRGETFDSLTSNDMKTLFSSAQNAPQMLKTGDDYIVAETQNIYDDSSSLTDEEKTFLREALAAQAAQEMSEVLLQDYAKDYKVEVNYNRMGLND